ncbi:hypothetical protein B0H10DRAFT_2017080 [Mycena sp. CBHHK59/15]|nr:hypothetical protein B0H10DRAFT_2017080 [Mycena sp. CBHHK59/15]
MALLELALLRVLHSFHFLIALISALWDQFHPTPPLPLRVTRRRTPHHLALLLVPDSIHDSTITQQCLLETVNRTVGWCRAIGIEKLTVYDTEGVLVDCAHQISQRASVFCEPDGYESAGSDMEYPLTPPSSDYSDSRPRSPEDGFQKNNSLVTVCLPEIRKKTSNRSFKRRQQAREKTKVYERPLTLHIASRHSSKPSIAAVASSLARRRAESPDSKNSQLNLSVEMLNSILEGPQSLSAPDFLILHHLHRSNYTTVPLELYGFPPWQIRLTEIHHIHKRRLPILDWLRVRGKTPLNIPQLIEEIDLRAALDEFAGAEMRFGK